MTRGTPAPEADPYYGLMGAVAFLQVLAFADRFLLSLLAVPVAHDLHVDDLQMGLLLGSAFIAPFAVATLAFGWMADRLAPRPLLLGGLALWTAATIASALVRTSTGLLLARLLLAAGEAAVAPVGLALLARSLAARQRAWGTSVFASAGPLGKGLALVGGGALLMAAGSLATPALASWRLVMLAGATLNLAAAPFLWFLLSHAAAPSPPRPGSGGHGRKAGVSPALWAYGAAGCSAVLASQALAAWAPVHLHRTLHLAVAQAGVLAGGPLMVAPALGGLTVAFVLSRRARAAEGGSRADLLAISLMVAALGALVFLAGEHVAPAMAGYVVLVAALGAANSAYLAGMQQRQVSGRHGEFAAWTVLGPNLVGFGLGPPIAGWLSKTGGGSALALRFGLLQVTEGACLLGAAAALTASVLSARNGAKVRVSRQSVAEQVPF